MIRWLLPRSANFFDYFEKHAALIVQSAKEFSQLVSVDADIPAHAIRIKVLEVEADGVSHQCIEALHKTFITPFDRYYIYQLTDHLDDIIDHINETAAAIVVYKLKEMTPEVREFASILDHASQELELIIKGFRECENIDELRKRFFTVKQYEKTSDTLLRKAIGHLFESNTDVRNIIKWKEIYLHMEEAVNRCEDVGNIVEGVILEIS